MKYPREESNLYLTLRTGLLYPLSYNGLCRRGRTGLLCPLSYESIRLYFNTKESRI